MTLAVPGTALAATSDAYVTAQLQEYVNGSWQNEGSAPQVHVPSGGGSGNRATGRAACSGTTLTWWRSQVTVVVTQGGRSTSVVGELRPCGRPRWRQERELIAKRPAT